MRVAVAVAIGDHLDWHRGYAWSTQGTLLSKVPVGERALRDALKKLSERGHLVIKRAHGTDNNKRLRTRNRYFLRLKTDLAPDLEATERLEEKRRRIADTKPQEKRRPIAGGKRRPVADNQKRDTK